MLHHADQDAADDVDADDQQAGHGVAAHELRRPVHGPEEGGFLLQLLAPDLGGLLVDQARRQVGVDGHLLAGHGIEGEPGGDLRDPSRTLGDDHEVHHHQDGEDDQADDEVARHHQRAEGLDDVAGAVGALVAVAQDQARGGDVQPQSEQGRHQKHGREGRELQRLLDHQRRHQDQHGARDRQRQQHVQQKGRDRHDQQDDDPDDADRKPHLATHHPPQRVAGGGAVGHGVWQADVSHGSVAPRQGVAHFGHVTPRWPRPAGAGGRRCRRRSIP